MPFSSKNFSTLNKGKPQSDQAQKLQSLICPAQRLQSNSLFFSCFILIAIVSVCHRRRVFYCTVVSTRFIVLLWAFVRRHVIQLWAFSTIFILLQVWVCKDQREVQESQKVKELCKSLLSPKTA